jgi:hypothetical protein
MTAVAEARWTVSPTTISRQRKMLAWLAHDRKKPLYQAVFATPSSRRQARTAAWDCIKDGKNIDPACGSGNLLTETYISLRRLEYVIDPPVKSCVASFNHPRLHGREVRP